MTSLQEFSFSSIYHSVAHSYESFAYSYPIYDYRTGFHLPAALYGNKHRGYGMARSLNISHLPHRL